MKHLPGGRTSAVMLCPSCPHSFEAVFCEPLGKEGRALRGELARLIEEVRSIHSAAQDAARLAAQREANMKCGHDATIGAVKAQLADCKARLQEARDRSWTWSGGRPSPGRGTTPTTWC